MSRIAVICGTGMSELTSNYVKSFNSDISLLRIESEWGEGTKLKSVKREEMRFKNKLENSLIKIEGVKMMLKELSQ